jgi:hypothetical protein
MAIKDERLKVVKGNVYKEDKIYDKDGYVKKVDGVIQYKQTKLASLNTERTGFSYQGQHYDIVRGSASGLIEVAVVGQAVVTETEDKE